MLVLALDFLNARASLGVLRPWSGFWNPLVLILWKVPDFESLGCFGMLVLALGF